MKEARKEAQAVLPHAIGSGRGQGELLEPRHSSRCRRGGGNGTWRGIGAAFRAGGFARRNRRPHRGAATCSSRQHSLSGRQRSWSRWRMRLARRMSLHYSMKPPERTISNSSFIMSATTSRHLLSKRRAKLFEDLWRQNALGGFLGRPRSRPPICAPPKRNDSLHRRDRLATRTSALPCIRLRQSGVTCCGAGASAGIWTTTASMSRISS